jgi:hypothetical protein
MSSAAFAACGKLSGEGERCSGRYRRVFGFSTEPRSGSTGFITTCDSRRSPSDWFLPGDRESLSNLSGELHGRKAKRRSIIARRVNFQDKPFLPAKWFVTRDFGAPRPTLEGMKTEGFYTGSKPHSDLSRHQSENSFVTLAGTFIGS